MENNLYSEKLSAAILGFVLGDALGVPYEFKSREEMDAKPATTMTGYGTHHQPPGTWSDDSSLMFCLMESLSRGYDLQDLANRFVNWYRHGYWTPHGKVFDIGISTRKAIVRMEQGITPTQCGGKGEYDNGNGALMRILPMAFYLLDEADQQVRFQKVKEVASLTHGHDISHIACCIYTELLRSLITGSSWEEAIGAVAALKSFLLAQGMKEQHLAYYNSVFEGSFATKERYEVHSSGFVVHTLEAALWCVHQAADFREAVLIAVNLGEDTDTTAAVTGGLAGYLAGTSALPTHIWHVANIEEIHQLISHFPIHKTN